MPIIATANDEQTHGSLGAQRASEGQEVVRLKNGVRFDRTRSELSPPIKIRSRESDHIDRLHPHRTRA